MIVKVDRIGCEHNTGVFVDNVDIGHDDERSPYWTMMWLLTILDEIVTQTIMDMIVREDDIGYDC